LRSAKALEAWGGQAVVIKVRFDSSTSRTIERAALLAVHAEPEKPPASLARGILLLDRDGTIVKSVPFLHEPSRVELVPGAAEALTTLQTLGLRLAIVTNQQGIGLGYFTTDDFIAVNQAMLKQLASHGVKISKIYYCPHSLADQCPCRKPGTRMLERALADFGFPPGRAFVVGDSGTDSGAAVALGIPALRIEEHDSASWDAAASAIEAAIAQW
jgi:D-glycero-D-manno-heptose 1,7-bisphosphate phosphatase